MMRETKRDECGIRDVPNQRSMPSLTSRRVKSHQRGASNSYISLKNDGRSDGAEAATVVVEAISSLYATGRHRIVSVRYA